MEIKSLDIKIANEYLQYLFDIGTFGTEYFKVVLENCSAIDNTVVLNIRGYKYSSDKYDGFACYPTLEDYEIFKKTVIRQENLDKLLNGNT